MTLTAQYFRFFIHFGAVIPASAKTETTLDAEDQAPEDRAFLRDMMARNPEAMQSDLGMMAMMSQYPRHF